MSDYDPDEDLTDQELDALWEAGEDAVVISPRSLFYSGTNSATATGGFNQQPRAGVRVGTPKEQTSIAS